MAKLGYTNGYPAAVIQTAAFQNIVVESAAFHVTFVLYMKCGRSNRDLTYIQEI